MYKVISSTESVSLVFACHVACPMCAASTKSHAWQNKMAAVWFCFFHHGKMQEGKTFLISNWRFIDPEMPHFLGSPGKYNCLVA